MSYFERARFVDPYGRAVDDTKDAFVGQGFSLLSQVDVRASLGRELENGIDPTAILAFYVPDIVGEHARHDPSATLALTFHVCVHASSGEASVECLHPALHSLGEDLAPFHHALEPLTDRVRAALAALAGSEPAEEST